MPVRVVLVGAGRGGGVALDGVARAARAALVEKLCAARRPLGDVEDVGGGGFRVYDVGRTRSIVVGGLGRALEERVYAQGVEHVRDVGPSTAVGGRQVHRHVFHLVECLHYKAACVCGSRFRKPATACARAREIMATVKRMGLAAVACELALVAKTWNVATRADLVCADAAGRLVLISLKTGAGGIAATERTLRGGLAHMVDTQRARHQVQLAAERLMLEKAGAVVHRGFIIYCTLDDAHARAVTADARLWGETGRAALDALMEARV